jgi:hypothetical protein
VAIRVTRKTRRLLHVLLTLDEERKLGETAGLNFHMPSSKVMQAARLSPASYYPLIARLEREGWVEGEWEQTPADKVGPRRLFYHLTAQGVVWTKRALEKDSKSLWRRLTRRIR